MKRIKYLALATLVAFAACDEGGDVVIPPVVTGQISGVVTIEGAAVSGISVALSSGATTTTDGSGAYSFADVAAGAYTITISGFAADATFSSTSKAVTIVTAGQVATVNFDGAYVRTSAILGSVVAGSVGLQGVKVSLGSTSTLTDAQGQYSFSGLRAGTYTVVLSGFDAAQYAFANTSQEVTVGVGESKVVSFNGQLLATATVGGKLYIDANGNLSLDGGEAALTVAGVTVGLEKAIGDTIYKVTDANGAYAFTDLEEGNYKAILKATDAKLTGRAVTLTAGVYLAAAKSGATTTVNFPFAVTTQYVQVGAYLGKDKDCAAPQPCPAGVGTRVAGVKNASIDLYTTDATANAGGAPGSLTTATPLKTGTDGTITFKFLRSADRGPLSTPTDNIVYARMMAAPNANHTLNGETVIEVAYAAGDSIVTATDEFDFIKANTVVTFNGVDGEGALANWQANLWTDTTAVAANGTVLGTTGQGTFAYVAPGTAYPYNIYVRLPYAQAAALGHAYSQTHTAIGGTVKGDYLRLIVDGTQADTVNLGTITVKYLDQHVLVRIHHERDDSTDVPTYTKGDEAGWGVDGFGFGSHGVQAQLYKGSTSVTPVAPGNNPEQGSGTTGEVLWYNVPTGTYTVRARRLNAAIDVLNDTSVTVVLDGGSKTVKVETLTGSAGYSTFAFKYNNAILTGTVASFDPALGAGAASPVGAQFPAASGVQVTIAPTADNIQPKAWKSGADTTFKTSGTGAFSLGNLREGPYTVTVKDSTTSSATVWGFMGGGLVTSGAFTHSKPFYGGSAANTDERTAARDLEGNGDADIVNFRAWRTDRKFSGTVMNDRDKDGNVIDANEALAGVIINLYKDENGTSVKRDSLVAADTTDANGAYSFSNLREGYYMAKVVAATPSTTQDVLRGLSQDSIIAQVSPTANTGTTTPAVLAQWDYNNSTILGGTGQATDFTFLFKNTEVRGTVKTAAGAAIAGMSIQIQRCQTSAGAVSPPQTAVAQACTAPLGAVSVVSSDATGAFTLGNLIEGVYQVTPLPGTVAGYTTSTPSSTLYLLVGTQDIESANFVIS